MKRFIPVVALVALGLGLAGCVSKIQPVYTPTSAVVAGNATLESVRETILKALSGSAWTVVDAQTPGEVTVRLTRAQGQRVITSKITYTLSDYTISLVDATEMVYDAEEGTISRKYNQWIRNLDLRIQQAFTCAQ